MFCNFKPCHVHGKNAQHLYNDYSKNPCNQKTSSKHARTMTASTDMTATTRITATPIATTSCTGVTILLCPARARLAWGAEAKRRRIIILIMMVKFPQNEGRSMCPVTLRGTKNVQTSIWDEMMHSKMLISMTSWYTKLGLQTRICSISIIDGPRL